MAKKQQPAWQFKLSFALSIFMLFLIFGYFYQSFLEVRKVKPVVVAIEKIKNKSDGPKLEQRINKDEISNKDLDAQ
jgi:hypothetical protein